jgi:sigma-B regulation protein RsbU (phosphoserine phosphatase)
MVLGLFEEQRYESGEVQLEPGELLVVFSDGVTEACDESGQFFGEDRLIDLLLRHADLPGDRLARAVIDAVDGFVGPHPQQDDITVITAQVAPADVSAPAA